MKKSHFAPLAAALAFALSSCAPEPAPTPEPAPSPDPASASEAPATKKDKLDVTVSILPHAFLVKSIGGDHVNVTILVTAGSDPHQFQITPAQTIALSKADAFFTSGMPFENQFLEKIKAGVDNLKVVPVNSGLELLEPSCTHDHGHDHAEHEPSGVTAGVNPAEAEEHDHDHSAPGAFDPHTWTSPNNLVLQAFTICDTLKIIAPAHADDFDANLFDLQSKIIDADTIISENLKPHKGRTFFVFHPAFKYFALQYGLTEKSIEFEGKSPSPKQLLAILEEAATAKAKTLFIQPQFDTDTTKEIARQIGADIVSVDPLTEDILTSLTNFSKALAESFSE